MKCPLCKAPSVHEYRPFCSRRCADRDLGKWLTNAYAVPSKDPEDVEKAQEESATAGRKPH